MGKFLLSLTLLVLLNAPVFAQSFDFSKEGDVEANEILKEAVKREIEGFHGGVVGYFYDINGNGKKEIIGIIKSKLYCTLAGYNLVVLEQNDDNWIMTSTNINFDATLPFDIERNKVTYHKSDFYKNKKTVATIKDNDFRAAVSIKEHYANKKLKGIEEATSIGEGHPSVEVDVNDFPECEQRAVNIEYPNGMEKIHYRIELH